MQKVNHFLAFLNKHLPFTEEDYKNYLEPVITYRNFKKKEIITKSGEVENYFNFIEQGLARKFYHKGKEEINTQISFEGHIMHAQESFHSRTPSEYTIETIEPTQLISITYEDLEKVYASSKKMEHMGRLVVTYSMVIKDRWQMQMVNLTPRERFLKFVTHNPGLIQRVPQKFLASYLHIKPETFSRFKHLIKEHHASKKL